MKDLVSIVLPVYNGATFLRDSIESVIAQTYKNWELLILDDCSTDETPEISREYEAKDSRIHYHRNEKNLKLPGNLNKGFSMAKGEYLTWTSDDNRYRPHALETMLTTIKEKEVGLVFADYQVIDENDQEIKVVSVQNGSKGRVLSYNVVGACFLYTREVYETVGDYDTELFLVEDWDYWQRVMMKFSSYAIAQILYDYRQHSASLTSTKNNVRFGEVSEKVLLKNRRGFGKLSLQDKRGYYYALNEARRNQGRKSPYAFKSWYLGWRCRMICLLRRIIKN
jgi:glycosyltransferase involved in cell wall biosynthesis